MSAHVFKVGDRVRVHKPGTMPHGKEGVITGRSENGPIRSNGRRLLTLHFFVTLDGIGARWPKSKRPVAFLPCHLVPILPTGFKLFMERVVQPVVLDAPPSVRRVKERT